jgi:prephenate dehydrogenase
MAFFVRKIAVLGAGLIGGSLLRAIRAQGLCGEVAAYDLNGGTADGLTVSASPADAVRDAGIVFLCVPIQEMKGVLEKALPALSPNTVVTDVGSVKGTVCTELEPLLQGKARFVGGHPMAGREKSGFEASRDDLFAGATVILTPTAFTDAEALGTVFAFWEALGARIEQMSPAEHDRRVAEVSHLPHLVAAALAQVPAPDSLAVSGPGFRDTTRIAEGPAGMWTEILLANREEVGRSLDVLIDALRKSRQHLRSGDGAVLQLFLEQANAMRAQLPPK